MYSNPETLTAMNPDAEPPTTTKLSQCRRVVVAVMAPLRTPLLARMGESGFTRSKRFNKVVEYGDQGRLGLRM